MAKTPIIFIAILFLSGILLAQEKEHPPVYRPGQTIRLAVTFDGPDAQQISNAQMLLAKIGDAEPGQENFSTQMYEPDAKQTGPMTFEIEYTILENQASGDYKLSEIRAVLSREHPVVFTYTGTEFSPMTFTIDNPKRLNKPKIKSIKAR